MKKYLIISILVGGFLWTISYVVAEEEIDFNPKIKQHLEDEYNMTKATQEFARSIETLDLSGLNLTSTKGLEHFTNLHTLDLSDNMLTDSSFLKNMKYLKTVDLSYNQFDDVEFSSTDIQHLNLRSNHLSTIDNVQSLKSLLTLNLRSNNIEDLTPLENLTQLTYLNIRGNEVKEVIPLASLKNLTDLNARNNRIHSIEPLLSLPLNDRLLVSGNDISDIALLKDKLEDIDETDIELGMPKPRLSKDSGIYEDSFELEMDVEEGHEVYYTLDGSIPNANSNKYEGPIEISQEVMLNTPVISNHKTTMLREGFSFDPSEVKKAVTIKAVSSFKPSRLEPREYSDPITATYILDDELFSSELPVISLTVDPHNLFDEHEGIYVPGIWYEEDSEWSGNYAQKGREHEKPATVDFFLNNGDLDFHQNIGIRINGRASRILPQKSLRLYSRSDYGQSRFYTNIFDDLPYNEFNLLLLRNAGQDYDAAFMRDGLMHELVKDRDVDVQAFQPSIVLINGEYWGIHNVREKHTPDYFNVKYNIRNSDLTVMKGFNEDGKIDFDIKSGSNKDKTDYNDLLTYVEKNDMTNDENIEYVERQVDLDNFFNYVAYQVYFANADSFRNNLLIWRHNNGYEPDAPEGHDGR